MHFLAIEHTQNMHIHSTALTFAHSAFVALGVLSYVRIQSAHKTHHCICNLAETTMEISTGTKTLCHYSGWRIDKLTCTYTHTHPCDHTHTHTHRHTHSRSCRNGCARNRAAQRMYPSSLRQPRSTTERKPSHWFAGFDQRFVIGDAPDKQLPRTKAKDYGIPKLRTITRD